MSTVIVTGGSGRLGRSVVAALGEAGHEVVSVDRIPHETVTSRQLPIDLGDGAATARAFDDIRPDAVVQLAAIAVPFSQPESDILVTNMSIAWNVIEAAVAAGARAILAASSPTVIGYGAPTGWHPTRLPIDERHPVRPWHAYGLSKVGVEAMIGAAVAKYGEGIRFGSFRPCFVITPEEWAGAPTQQGHTVRERLDDPALAAGSLFNYVDARDAADFVVAWVAGSAAVPNGSTFFVGASDALAREPLSELIPRYVPTAADHAAGLTGSDSAFDSAAAEALGWRARRSWRTELGDPPPDAQPPESTDVPSADARSRA